MKRAIILLLILWGVYGVTHIPESTVQMETSSESLVSYPVIEVIDGDTIVVKKDNEEIIVRLLGIDTPEVDPSRGKVECYGKEASAETKRLLTGTSVTLETDPSQDMYDQYGRLLAYVSLSDTTLINKLLVESGYAREYTFDNEYLYQADFVAAEKVARENQRGLWSKENCP